MELLTIERVLIGLRRGSSRPIVVDTSNGRYLVKTRGAAQGTGALVAEIIVAHLAECLNLPILERRLALLNADTPVEEKDGELKDLVAASVGINLAFPMLPHARDATVQECSAFTHDERSRILWLDRFVLNPDRTRRNPNVLWHGGKLVLIDHGSALRFQYRWSEITEESPRAVGAIREPHLFETMAQSKQWIDVDAACANRMTRRTLEDAVNAVPASFLAPLLPAFNPLTDARSHSEAIRRRRAAYVAFLWKRLKAPRAFANEPATFLPDMSRAKSLRTSISTYAGP